MQNLVIVADSPEAFRAWLHTTISELVQPTQQAPNPAGELLTRRDVCRQFGISTTTLNEWCKSGIVPFVRLGRRVYFEPAKVLEAGRSHLRYQRKG